MKKGGKNENDGVVSPESVLIHFNLTAYSTEYVTASICSYSCFGGLVQSQVYIFQ